MTISRETRTLIVTAVLAVGVPVVAGYLTRARTDELAEHISDAAGVETTIGSVDASLGGSIRVERIALGKLVSATAIEGSVNLSSLLDGQLRADEIRVEGPRVAVEVDPDGDSDRTRRAPARRAPAQHGR